MSDRQSSRDVRVNRQLGIGHCNVLCTIDGVLVGQCNLFILLLGRHYTWDCCHVYRPSKHMSY